MHAIKTQLSHLEAWEEGQGVIEYVLVAGVISMALFAAFSTTGIVGEIGNAVGRIVSTMAGT